MLTLEFDLNILCPKTHLTSIVHSVQVGMGVAECVHGFL